MGADPKYPNIEALAAGTIAGAFRDWPRLRPEAKAILEACARKDAALDDYVMMLRTLAHKLRSDQVWRDRITGLLEKHGGMGSPLRAALAEAAPAAGELRCVVCGNRATCVGNYRGEKPLPACDECCAHTWENGCGSCEPLPAGAAGEPQREEE